MVNFVFDEIKKDDFNDPVPRPNCSIWDAQPLTGAWHEFSTHFPFSEPVHFIDYLQQENVEYKLHTTASAPKGSYYPISISFHDYRANWFELMSSLALERFKKGDFTLWVFYSEGDNPYKIIQHLKRLAVKSGVSRSQVLLTSANSKASSLEQCSYFIDDELLYRYRNKSRPCDFHGFKRKKLFTSLVRVHKYWRAATMATLWEKGYHHQGYFSYNTKITLDDTEERPLRMNSFKRLENTIEQFLKEGPFVADTLTSDEHNDHRTTVRDHHDESYLNIIIETHLDVDSTNGAFITEKTFKAIKNSQLFVIVGAVNSVAQLRKLGYKTFDHVIDHSYDSEADNTLRWVMVIEEIQRLLDSDLYSLYQKCEEDIKHNQQLFLSSKADRLNNLLRTLDEQSK